MAKTHTKSTKATKTQSSKPKSTKAVKTQSSKKTTTKQVNKKTSSWQRGKTNTKTAAVSRTRNVSK